MALGGAFEKAGTGFVPWSCAAIGFPSPANSADCARTRPQPAIPITQAASCRRTGEAGQPGTGSMSLGISGSGFPGAMSVSFGTSSHGIGISTQGIAMRRVATSFNSR